VCPSQGRPCRPRIISDADASAIPTRGTETQSAIARRPHLEMSAVADDRELLLTAKTFRDLGVDDALSDALEAKGITHPFPIQELALPLALDGNDLIGQARTGTGKTLAFGLPLLQRLDPERKVTQALVIVPTRELCVQVHEDLQIGAGRGLSTISVYGGVPYEAQIEALTSGVHVVVGTPGRLLDHLNRGNLDLSEVRTLVLDEADEMLDMGFLPDVERLIEACNTDRHSMLFSATMPTEIVKLARRYLTHPTFTRADTEQHETAPNVEQHFFTVHRMDKPRVLARILQSPNRGGAYVFVRTKMMADRLVGELEDLSVPAVAVHGDLRQQTREKNLDRFRDGRADVLVCTEVAARGIDVADVTHVINYDCPDDEKMYLHRIGRTARAGKAGVAVTFAEFNEVDRLNVIRKAVGATDNETKQIFSTSAELTELFDLPAERPWDHLAERTSGGGGKGRDRRDDRGKGQSGRDQGKDRSDRDRGRDGGRGERGGDRPKGKSDGRSKSRRSAETGGARTGAARRREDRPAPRGKEASTEKTASREKAPTADAGSERSTGSDTRARREDEAPRVRTRTRTRAQRGAGGGRDAEGGDRRGRSAAGDAGDEPRRQRSQRREHTRARADDHGEDAPSDTREDASGDRRPRGGARQRDGDARKRAGSAERRSDRSRSGGAGSDRGEADRSGSGRGSGGSGSGRGGGRRSGSGRSGSGRGGSGRGGSDRGGRDGRRSEDSGGEVQEVQPKGRSARGEGQPQLARRVQVDHLP
jgi:superfamily II DNA/RNA helicase